MPGAYRTALTKANLRPLFLLLSLSYEMTLHPSPTLCGSSAHDIDD
ncbi:hypothetical protein CpipJ_CPIJ003221 [Culex quinquefasciatus]|uniref:Uncharacterized protein n=1 Tax=Culex quinquefasciatus TaxID=7176 RepID=B0W7A8_CULQU|nr:hypothetical protein CpipJ_CPIJ003221 [Culex quinquefasciatus]|eukprot:XP_001844592.1 hypothetical protein CpipJ_CPIJ003221 [Culex quinquefasciatus]